MFVKGFGWRVIFLALGVFVDGANLAQSIGSVFLIPSSPTGSVFGDTSTILNGPSLEGSVCCIIQSPVALLQRFYVAFDPCKHTVQQYTTMMHWEVSDHGRPYIVLATRSSAYQRHFPKWSLDVRVLHSMCSKM